MNHTDLPKIIDLYKEHCGESCFNKSADLGRKLRTSLVAASEDEHDETKLLHMTSQLNKCYL